MHALRAYILKEDAVDLTGIPHVKHNGFAIMPMTDKLFAFLGNPPILITALCEKLGSYAEIETDYFGGFGEQTAALYIDKTAVYVKNPDHPINEALKALGVMAPAGMDEFDTLKLGNYRTSDDIISEWEATQTKSELKSGLEIERRFLLKTLPVVIKSRIFNGMRGLKINQVYTNIDGVNIRYRRTYNMETGGSKYYETKKTTISHGVNQEDEREITEAEYYTNTQNALKAIHKTRYEFVDPAGLKWEIDDFGSMVIAEIELPAIDHPIDIPEDLLKVLVLEVTGMQEFSNYNLAVHP